MEMQLGYPGPTLRIPLPPDSSDLNPRNSQGFGDLFLRRDLFTGHQTKGGTVA